MQAGSAVRGLAVYGHRAAAAAHAAVVLVCAGLAPLAAPEHQVPATLAVAVLAIGWNVVYCLGLLRRRVAGLVVGDVLITGVVCLSQPWTVRPEAVLEGGGWVLAVASISVVTYQWHTGPRAGALGAVLVVVAYNVGCGLSLSSGWSTPMGLWMLVQAVMSRGLFELVRRGGERADAIRARGARVRREAAVSAAQRADQREYLAALHDTAAATLLMVGAGMVRSREPWLAEQAGRDLEMLNGQVEPEADEADLVRALRALGSPSRLRISWETDAQILLSPGAAEALGRSAREALANVLRHSGADRARVSANRRNGLVVVEIVDRGVGFDPGAVPAGRHGLSGSIIERMHRAGGRAVISSAPGRGTTVRLEWPSPRPGEPAGA